MTKPHASMVLTFVLLLGVVNLFADLTYEWGRSIIGPFLAQLGASAAVVSIVSGVGEFFGLVGSIAFGLMYDRSLPTLTAVSVMGQLLSLPLFVAARHAAKPAATR